MLQSQRDDQVLVGPREGMRVDDDAAIFLRREGRYRPLDVGRIVDAARRGLDAKARRGRLQRTPERLMNGRLGMHDHHHPRDPRYGLFQHLKPLAPDRAIEAGETGDVAARMSKARDEPIANWIANPNKYTR
jgi:hypothetical protein